MTYFPGVVGSHDNRVIGHVPAVGFDSRGSCTSGGEEGGRRDAVHRFSSMLALVM
jgi:hypothetical protein